MSKPRQIPAPASARGRSASSHMAQTAQHLAPETAAPALAFEPLDAGDELAELERLLGDFGPSVEGFVARIERVQRPGIEADLCGYLGTVAFSGELFDEVRSSFGGGRFRARICDGDGRYKRSFTFTIAGAAKRPGESAPAAPVGVGPASAGDSRLERMMANLADSLASMAVAIQHVQQAPRNSEDELERSLKLIKAVKDATGTPAPAADSLTTLEAFFRIQDMIDDRAPRGGGAADNIGQIVEHGVKPIAALMTRSLDIQERAMQRQQQNALRRVAGAQPAAAPIDSAPDVASEAAEHVGDALSGDEQAGAIDPVLSLAASIPPVARLYLASQARNDRDPETYAIMALDTIQEHNPETYAELPELLERDDFAAVLLEAIPHWATYPEWFGELVTCMRAQLADGDDGGTPPHSVEAVA